jgi:hypothetical protein
LDRRAGSNGNASPPESRTQAHLAAAHTRRARHCGVPSARAHALPEAAQRAGRISRQARYWVEIGLASAIVDEHGGLSSRYVLDDEDLARIVTVAAPSARRRARRAARRGCVRPLAPGPARRASRHGCGGAHIANELHYQEHAHSSGVARGARRGRIASRLPDVCASLKELTSDEREGLLNAQSGPLSPRNCKVRS